MPIRRLGARHRSDRTSPFRVAAQEADRFGPAVASGIPHRARDVRGMQGLDDTAKCSLRCDACG